MSDSPRAPRAGVSITPRSALLAAGLCIALSIFTGCGGSDDGTSGASLGSDETVVEMRGNTPESLSVGSRCDWIEPMEPNQRPTDDEIREAFVAVPAEEDPRLELLFSGNVVEPGETVFVAVGRPTDDAPGVEFEPLPYIDAPSGTYLEDSIADMSLGVGSGESASLCLPLVLDDSISQGDYRVWIATVEHENVPDGPEPTLSGILHVVAPGTAGTSD